MDERTDYYQHWTAADWKRLNEQRRRDAERLREQIAEERWIIENKQNGV